MNSETKPCSKCGTVLPLENFHRNSKMRFGRFSFCRACSAAYNKSLRDRYSAAHADADPRKDPARAGETKRCPGCSQTLPLLAFYFVRSSRNGCSSYCKTCTLITVAKSRAAEAGLPFDLTPDDIVVPDICPALGIELSTEATKRHADNSPSIDRIVPELGYVRGNVEVVSWLYNRIKSNITDPSIFEKIAFHMRRWAQ